MKRRGKTCLHSIIWRAEGSATASSSWTRQVIATIAGSGVACARVNVLQVDANRADERLVRAGLRPPRVQKVEMEGATCSPGDESAETAPHVLGWLRDQISVHHSPASVPI